MLYFIDLFSVYSLIEAMKQSPAKISDKMNREYFFCTLIYLYGALLDIITRMNIIDEDCKF